jgi:protein-arginine kinase activator protein McsA
MRLLIDGRPAALDALPPEISALTEIISAIGTRAPEAIRCPHCGVLRSEVEATALAGCPMCYVVFGDWLVERFSLSRSTV